MSNSHVQSAKAIAEGIAHLCCVPDDWRFQISDLAAWPFPTFCAKPLLTQEGPNNLGTIAKDIADLCWVMGIGDGRFKICQNLRPF